MAITKDDVLHVARLARLELTDAEVERMVRDLGRILEHVEELSSVETNDVPPTTTIAVEVAPLRKDEVQPCLDHDQALAEAPRAAGGGFAVPTFVDEG